MLTTWMMMNRSHDCSIQKVDLTTKYQSHLHLSYFLLLLIALPWRRLMTSVAKALSIERVVSMGEWMTCFYQKQLKSSPSRTTKQRELMLNNNDRIGDKNEPAVAHSLDQFSILSTNNSFYECALCYVGTGRLSREKQEKEQHWHQNVIAAIRKDQLHHLFDPMDWHRYTSSKSNWSDSLTSME